MSITGGIPLVATPLEQGSTVNETKKQNKTKQTNREEETDWEEDKWGAETKAKQYVGGKLMEDERSAYNF